MNQWIFRLMFIFSGTVFANTPLPFKSKTEKIDFMTKKESPEISIFKTDSFYGIVRREDQKGRLRNADVYALSDEGKIKVTKDLCEKYLAQIVGPLDAISPKVKKMEVFKTDTGDACQIQMESSQKGDHIVREQLIVIGFINAKPFGIAFNFRKSTDVATQENVRKFWEGLR